jgi:putative transposase
MACGRYIERNPVAAHIVPHADVYPYSSARFYTKGVFDGLSKTNALYETFGKTSQERQAEYTKFLLGFDEEEHLYFDNMEAPIGEALYQKQTSAN